MDYKGEMKSKHKNRSLLIFGFCAFIFTSFLFFIDEGYYDFNWTKRLVNWVVFAIYALPIFLLQFLIFKLLPRELILFLRYLVSVIVGAILGTIITVLIFYYIK